jgi:coenzyme F420-reducing hydrogenase delta subunit/DNA-binding transcriptional ArsR family regulator
MKTEKPKFACFVCKWAVEEEELETAASSKTFSNVSTVSVTCIGQVDPVVMMETLLKGAEGVLLVGCAPPDCHFVKGNVYAENTVNVLKKLLALAHLEPERLELQWFSPMQETAFSKILTDFSKKLSKLGASPLSKQKFDSKIFENVLAAKNAVDDFYLRAYIGKENALVNGANVYDEKIQREEFDALLDKVIQTEFVRHRMLLATKEKPSSVKELAVVLDMKPAVVLRHILNMRRKGLIALDRFEGTTPVYRALEVT